MSKAPKTTVQKGLVDTIILRFNTPNYDIRCIRAMIENTKYPQYQITLLDNYIPRFPLSTIWNMLIDKSFGEYICLLNNDTQPQEGWLTKLVEVFEKEERVGAVGPSTNQCHSPQKIKTPSLAVRTDLYSIVDFEKTYGKTFQLSGFCILFPKEVWVEVGGFDENFGFYAQENEFLHRVQMAGYRTLWRKDAYVWHAGEASVRKVAEKEGLDIAEERRRGNILYQEALRRDGFGN